MIPHADLPRRGRRRPFVARSIGRIVPEAQPVDWFDATTPGLALRVSPGGARTWYAFYRKGRTTRRVKLGSWPALALARARILARQTRVRAETDGADPAHERRAARDVFTVGDLAKLYIEQHAKAHKTTWKDDQWRLDRYVLPAWKSRPVGEITRADVHALLDQITGDGKPIQANRVQALVSKLWNVAIRSRARQRQPVLSDGEAGARAGRGRRCSTTTRSGRSGVPSTRSRATQPTRCGSGS